MSLGLVGRKLGMTQINAAEERIAVTLIEAGPCLVIQKKTLEKDGYTALKVAFGPELKDNRSNKAQKGVFKKLNVKPRKNIMEFRITGEKLGNFEEGQEIKISDVFTEGQYVDVVGITKGRGFTGVIKGWNMKGNRATHGTHEFFRHAGSIGCRTWPGRVWKNKHMPGNYGNEKVTVQNLKIVKILADENCVAISGAVPGARNGILEVYPSVRYPGTAA